MIRIKQLSPGRSIILGYIIIILIGTIFLLFPISTANGKNTGFLEAIFTATSATSLTGLLIVDTVEHWSLFGQTVIMILFKIGGLGFITTTTLFYFIFDKEISLRERLIIMKELNYSNLSDVVALSRYIIILTFIIELIGAFFLFFFFYRFMSLSRALYFSIFHSISAFNNAGFSLFTNSLEYFTSSYYLNLIIALLFILGGTGFIVIDEIYHKKRFDKLSLHSKLVVSINIFLIIIGTFGIFFLEYNNPATIGNLNLKGKILSSFFHGVTPRSAGFNTIPIKGFKDATLFIIMLLMYIGASPVSTGSGVKTTTVGTLILVVYNMIIGEDDIEVFNRRLKKENIYKALTIVVISLLIIILLVIILSLTEEYPFIQIIFEIFSSFGTVGLTTGIIPFFSLTGKILMIIAMFIGRVGPFTLALALGQRYHEEIRYPEEDIIIG